MKSVSKKSLVAVVLTVPAALALVACTGLDLQASPSENKSTTVINVNGNGAICVEYCTKLNNCDNSRDLDTCTNRCANANASTLPKLREEIVSSMSSCLQGQDCKTILDKDPVATCAAEAVAASAPSEAATALCDAMAKAKTKCSDSYSKASCLTLAKLFNDSAIAEAQKCTEKPCDAIDACFDAALGAITDGDSSTGDDDPPPSTSSSSGTTSSSSSSSGSSGPTPPAPSGSSPTPPPPGA